jgi:hypothetical protein
MKRESNSCINQEYLLLQGYYKKMFGLCFSPVLRDFCDGEGAVLLAFTQRQYAF